MNTLRIVARLTFALSLLGCASSPEGALEPATDGLLPGGAAKADGRSYFEQFMYRIDETGGTYLSGEPRRTYSATNWDETILLSTAEGQTREVGVDLWLLEDGTAYVEYEEQSRRSSYNATEDERIVRTTWSESNDVLTLSGVGTGVAGSDNRGRPSIELTFDRDIVTSGLSGQTLDIIRVLTSARLEHVERDFAAQEG